MAEALAPRERFARPAGHERSSAKQPRPAARDRRASGGRRPPRKQAFRSKYPHAVFVAPIRVDGDGRVTVLLVRPPWQRRGKVQWQLAGGKRIDGELGEFADTGRRRVRGECGASPRDFKHVGEALWVDAGGQRGHNVLVVWGQLAEGARPRTPTPDDEGRPHHLLWATLDERGRLHADSGHYISVRDEVKFFVENYLATTRSKTPEASAASGGAGGDAGTAAVKAPSPPPPLVPRESI